jgi:hypothetical protein
MKLSHAVFVYPRIELFYIKEWLDYHEKQGIDHVYISVHLNNPRNKKLNFEQILWTKKPGIPYVKDYTEDELFLILKEKIKDHIDKNRITFNLIDRKIDRDGKSHRKDQINSYNWAKNQVLSKRDSDWDWLLVGDVDEFFVPEDARKTIKEIICQEKRKKISSLRCWCVMHPSRYDFPCGDLPWNIYINKAGARLCTSKYASKCSSTNQFLIHWSIPNVGFETEFNPSFNVHHFRGFNYCDINLKGWPIKNRLYKSKKDDEPYFIKKPKASRSPLGGPCN